MANSTVEFLSHLSSLNINLETDGERLRCHAPEGVLNPMLRQEIAERKTEIIFLLQQAKQVKASNNHLPIQRVPKDGELPLSFAQQQLWFLQQLLPDNHLSNMLLVLRLSGSLNIAALEQSLSELIRRHEVLRTTFPTVNGKPFQSIAPATTLTVPVIDRQGLSAQEQTDQIQQIAAAEASKPFDLVVGPLLQFTLLQLGEQEYIFLLKIHHIIYDGWSSNIFVRELSQLYEAFTQGLPYPLAELPIQYADFAVWQRQWLQGDVLQTKLTYWQQKLANAPALLSLPTDRSRPAVQTFHGASQEFALSQKLSVALIQLSQKESVTLFMTLLAAFQTLLWRYSGQDDICIGTPIANRNRAETEGLIGFFVNSLVLHTYLGDNPSFRQLLAQVREVCLGAYAHQDLPFEMLVEALQPERNLSHHPIFQVWFNLLNLGDNQLELSGLSVEPISIPTAEASKFDLSLYITEREQGIKLELVYNNDLFSSERMVEMLQQFHHLLSQIIAAPDSAIASYSLVTPQAQLLLPNPRTVLPESEYELVTTTFTSWVNSTPEQSALCQESRTWNYWELGKIAQALAQVMLSHGVERGDVVAVYGTPSLGLIASMIAVLLSGGVLLTLDPQLPSDRQRLMLQEAKATNILYADSQPPEDLEIWQSLTIICVNPDTGLTINSLNKSSHTIPLPEISADDPAYIFFTSGTTGVPKGVLGCHKGMAHFLNWQRQTFGIGQQDRIAQLTGLSFDVVLRDIFLPLTSGATLCLPAEGENLEPTKILCYLEREQISVLHTVPSLAQSWLVNIPSEVSLSNLRWLFLAGEPLKDTLVLRWRDAFPQAGEIVNLYGPTETTLAKCYYQVPSEPIVGVQPVGWPIPETQALVFNQNHQQCGIGELGEIVLRTPFHSLGYINAKEEKRSRFVKNPFQNDEGDLLYYTGDRGRYHLDGSLEILGRQDHQVKIRGIRIELGEIETVLAQHPSVDQTVVIAREDVLTDQCLVAYVILNQKSVATISEIRGFLSTKLPQYMIPSSFVFLDSLPLTPNGKIDRRALPSPNLAQELSDKYVAPRSPIEEILALIWADVLKLEQVGIHDNFFELGGNSLLATQLLSRIRNSLRVEIPLRSVFAAATLAELAHLIGQLQQQNLELSAPPILPRAKNAQLPLSFAQTRLWFLDQLEPNSAFYNIPMALRLEGTLQVPALEQSLQEIIARHEALRTNFIIVEGQPTQIVQTETNWTVSVVDLKHLPTTEQEIATQQLGQQQAIQPFDLANEALVRAKLVVLSETEHRLFVCMHHIVSDAWSIGVFVQELAALYNAYSQGQLSPLAPLPIQYADFAIWQRHWLQGEVLQTQLSYWQKQLASAPALLSLPTDRPRKAVQTFNGAYQEFVLSQKLTSGLTQLSQQQGVTLFMTLLAAFDTLLLRYTGTEDILVGTPIANRNRSEIERLIGFFVNTLVLRTDVSGDPSFSELLVRVREMALFAYGHQDLPFEMLVEALQPERNLSHTPLFQVMFVLQNTPMSEVELAELSFSPLIVERTTAKFDLTLAMANTSTGLLGVWEYNTDLFDQRTIERMSGHFQTLLEGIVANPKERISQLPLLTEVEQQQLLVDWNNTQSNYPQDKCIHQLFEEQYLSTPNAVAVVYENQHLTYRELNCRANQLAHYLQTLGVKPDVLVGICVERSLEMVVGLLGILKAGGAYVPLDPNYPTERLSFMLEDAQVRVLLTQQKLLDKLPQHQAHLVYLDNNAQEFALANEIYQASEVKPSNLAYVLYTSGSTGRPKAVAIEHHSPVALVSWAQEVFTPLELSGVLASTSICFDLSVFELFVTLSVGGKVILAENALHLSTITSANQVTLINTVPSAIAQLIQENNLPKQVCTVNLAGEPLQNQLVQQIYQDSQVERVFNLYGPSEDTTYSTFSLIEKGTTDLPTIGRPIANTQIYILDQYLQPVPVGIPGELHIGGAGLARGYLNRPELTKEKFIPNPFRRGRGAALRLRSVSREQGSRGAEEKLQQSFPSAPYPLCPSASSDRLYKTGDLARYLNDGNIEYLGRIDNQVKVRGFRIELGEIEAVLSQHGHVQASCAIAREDMTGDKRLVAYVVPHPEVTLTTSELRQFLKTKLPLYMVPNTIVILEALPLTPNGKIDRRAMPAPSQSSNSDRFVAPRNNLELQLTQIWSKILKVDKVGVQDNFFDLGGHSLLATYLMARIKQQLLKDVPLVTLFQNPTIEQLATILQQDSVSSCYSPLVAIQPNGSNLPFFSLPGAGGYPFYFYNLARYLGPDQPLYSFQANNLDGGLQPITQVEDIAAHYIQAIQAVQPQGPYFLGGHSFGGKVAFEMAQQLLHQGHLVALVVIFDTKAPTYQKNKTGADWDDTKWLTEFAKALEIVFAKNLDISYETLQPLEPKEQLKCVLQRFQMVNILPPDVQTTQLNNLVQVFKANHLVDYLPQQVYPTRITLLRASEASVEEPTSQFPSEILQDTAWGWSKFSCEPVDIHFVPGNHITMMTQPHVQILAEQLRACIQKAQATTSDYKLNSLQLPT
ncbi:non-ribosomal peptide synthetase [Nostoc sp. LPT]|uniref:non-ribosomal peptide synthetase n=1 Tax=Nostoc sp. LPT TaxID=2815387 RepID=UPI001D5D5CA7|nr:non-ribosomal peptide synthetase [Nostoc sp. LPT]MBN4004268.1 amino acid adenylation domain-containing protein [Nostoc sp. LPT]